MCTSITLSHCDSYFGRTLDLDYGFDEQVVITPRDYVFQFRRQPPMYRHYAMIGMANVTDDYPLYAEAVNEKGLYMAGLYFPGNAYYPPSEQPGMTNVAPFELIPWLLGQCESVAQAKKLLSGINPIGISFSSELPLTSLHWHVADRHSAVVVEPLKNGLKLYDDPVGVLTNNPTFDFHLTNLHHYMQLTPQPPENRFSKKLPLSPFGMGMGGIGLPGDFSPSSRFVKAAFCKQNSVCEPTEEATVSQFFHILDAVSMVRGSVVTQHGKMDITRYWCCTSGKTGTYYYKTYENNQITAVGLFHEQLDSTQLKLFPLLKSQQIRYCN